jgi:hypothetical protein
MLDDKKDVLGKYIKDIQDIDDSDDEWRPMVTRWARLQLPNGQIARSTWKEKEMAKVRITRNVKVGNKISFYRMTGLTLFLVLFWFNFSPFCRGSILLPNAIWATI